MDFLPGDMLACLGHDALSWTICLATGRIPPWGVSHTMIVGPLAGNLVVWESTGLCDLPCLIHGDKRLGVQAHGIEERIADYRGTIWHMPLRHKLDAAQVVLLSDFLQHHRDDSYDAINAFRARRTPLSWIERRLTHEGQHAVFCSEFAAAGLQAADVWQPPDCRMNPNRLTQLLLSEPYRICSERRRIKG